jgi:hypothetical protein
LTSLDHPHHNTIEDKNDNHISNQQGISKSLLHSVASEYMELTHKVLLTYEENQIRDFLLIREKMKPSITVFQKIFCLFIPIYRDLGKAPGVFHNLLNCNGCGSELFYTLITWDGIIPGFLYGLCHSLFRSHQIGMTTRISEDSWKKLSNYIDHQLLKATNITTTTTTTSIYTNNVIHQTTNSDFEEGGNQQMGSEIDNNYNETTSSFEQATKSVDMVDNRKFDAQKCCIIC